MAQGSGESAAKHKPAKNAASAKFGMDMPLMSSAFDTAMWLNAA